MIRALTRLLQRLRSWFYGIEERLPRFVCFPEFDDPMGDVP